jgi:hypothetical protein
MNWTRILIIAIFIMCPSVSATFAQNAINDVNNTEVTSETKKTEKSTEAAKPKPQVEQEGRLSRWFELQSFTLSTRYRKVSDSVGNPFLSQNQHREIIDGKFKFDSKGRYSLNAHVSSGYYFNWAYADSGWGKGTAKSFPVLARDMAPFQAKSVIPGVVAAQVQQIINTQFAGAPQSVIDQMRPVITAQVTAAVTPIVTKQVETAIFNQVKNLNNEGWNLYFRQFYFSAKPIEGVEFQYGGIGINRGVNSEMTSYDNDGYLVGGRVSVKRPKNFFFDEISITYAYLGDLFKPNFFRRLDRMNESNYHQFLVRKKLGNRAEVSVDYTFQDRVDMMREAIRVNVKETKVLDTLRFETYQRIGDNTFVGSPGVFKAGMGFAVQGEKLIKRKVLVGGGYSQIDRDYSALSPGAKPFGFAINGDRTGLGNRFFGSVDYQITPELTFNLYASKPVKMNPAEFTWNRNYLTVGFTFDALKTLQKAGLFR